MTKVAYNSLSVPNRMATLSYSCRLLAIKSGHPRVFNWLAATLEARVSPGNVTTGVPVHNTSILKIFLKFVSIFCSYISKVNLKISSRKNFSKNVAPAKTFSCKCPSQPEI